MALEDIEAGLESAWAAERARHAETDAEALARQVLEHPGRHDWRLVDAAMDRLECPDCGARLGSGARGCASCDLADGYRFAARETDRPGVPPGNEHAIRVSSVALRAPHRWPASAVRGNELFLPLFLAGLTPTRGQQERFEAAAKRGLPDRTVLAKARTFEELAELAWTGRGARAAGRSAEKGNL